MIKELNKIREAYKARDVAAYRSGIKGFLKEAESLSTTARVSLMGEVKRLVGEDCFVGLEPLVFGYLKLMARSAKQVDSESLRQLLELAPFASALKGKKLAFEGSPLRIPRSPADCAHFWREWVRSMSDDRTGGLPSGFEDGIISCLGEIEYPEIDLTDQMELPRAKACAEYAVILNPPANIPTGLTATAVPGLPWGGRMRLDSDGRKIAIYTQSLFELPVSARSESFIIRISSGGNDTDFHVTLPVELGINLSCDNIYDITHWNFLLGETVDIHIYGSGPQSPLNWSWNSTNGGWLPLGLALDAEFDSSGVPTGHAHLHGTVQFGAHSERGEITLTQGIERVQRPATIRIPVYLPPGALANLEMVREIARGQNFSLQLPTAYGGDGDPANYSWNLEPGSSLPPGLVLTRRGNNWFVEGTVTNTAPVEKRRVRMRIDSGPDEVGRAATMNFNLSIPLRVWTQNMRLFPSDYIPTLALVGLCLWPASPSCIIPTTIEAIWDSEIPNTDEDNAQRAGFLIQHLVHNQQQNLPYDIVALQEVWESPFTDGMRDQIASDASNNGYAALDGPQDSGFEISSGLVLLVRNDFSAPSSTHYRQVFSDGAGFDDYAQKGLSISKVSFSTDPNDYIYVVNAHLQAGDEPNVRSNQLSQMRRFIDDHSDPSHPVVIMGDFNIASNGSEYQPMLNQLGNPEDIFASTGARPYTSDPVRNAYARYWDNPAQPENERKRIDYIFIRQGTAYYLVVDSTALEDREYTTYLCRDGRTLPSSGWLLGHNAPLICYMSDHFGLSASLRLNKR